MTISYPLDILAGFPGTTTRFELSYVQEVSATRGGRQNSIDLGPALWMLEAKSKPLRPSELKAWKARLASLENGAKTLIGYDLTAGYPIAYPNGSWPTGVSFDGVASLHTVGGDNKSVTLADLPVGFVVSAGDYISFDYGSGEARALHQAMETVTANGSGITPAFEVRPHIRVGFQLDSDVSLRRPHAVMVIVPGSVQAPSQTNAQGAVSFSAIQTLF